MKQLKRIISILTAMVLVLGICTGCKSSEKEEGFSLVVDGKKVDMPYVLKVGDDEISYAEFRYHFLDLRDSVNEVDPDALTAGSEVESQVIEAAMYSVKTTYTLEQMAKKYGVELTEMEQELIDQQVEALSQKFGSKEEYKEQMATINLTEDLYAKMLKDELIQQKVYKYLCENDFLDYKDEIFEEINSTFIRASHILVDDESLAEELAMRARAGEDFDELVAQYGADPGMEDNTDGYYFIEGEMITEFYEAAKALKVGEISDPVETSEGYHVIKRLPLEDDYLNENLTECMQKTDYVADLFNRFVEEEMEKITFVEHENVAKISVDSVK